MQTSLDLLWFVDLQTEAMDAEISQIIDGRTLSGGGNDLKATEVEFASKCIAYAIAAAS